MLTVSDIHDFDFPEYQHATGRPGMDMLALGGYTTYLTCFKSQTNLLLNHVSPSSVKLKVKNGFKVYDNALYSSLVSALKPSYAVGLSEDPSSFSETVSKKQVSRASQKTSSLLQSLETEQPTQLIAALLDHSLPEIQKEQVTQLKEVKGLRGVMLTGYNNGQLLQKESQEGLRKTLSLLEEELPWAEEVILLSRGSVMEVLQGVLQGVSTFTTEYPFHLAK